jgi:hypothetical protein
MKGIKVMTMNSYIILKPSGNTYFGKVAQKALFNKDFQQHLVNLSNFLGQTTDNKYMVYERKTDKSGDFFVCKAGQKTKAEAMNYMNDDRVLVFAEGEI